MGGTARSFIASLLLPGLGQALAGRRQRGAVILLATMAIALVVAGGGGGNGWLLLAPFWLLQSADASAMAGGRQGRLGTMTLLGLIPLYVIGWQLTEMAPERLITGFPRVAPLFRGLARPDFIDPVMETLAEAHIDTYTPCGDKQAPSDTAALEPAQPSLRLEPACVDLGAPLALSGAGFPPGELDLTLTNGGSNARIRLGAATVGADGAFRSEIRIPPDSVNVVTQQSRTAVEQTITALMTRDTGRITLSQTLRDILARLSETIAIGFLATLLGTLLALPFSLLGARNLMGGSRVTRLVYRGARLAMNVVRSIESLILAIIFVVWVSQGPFAGMLALMVHTVAAVGKLFSETIEGVDEGPVEAIRASGARWAQLVRYAVLPQVTPSFIAYSVYRWDINIRMSTVVGLVGGGGLGMLLTDWLKLGFWSQAATAILVIALVIIPMESVSNRLRDRVFSGQPVLGPAGRTLAPWLLLAATVWAWRTAEVAPLRLLRDARKVLPIAGSFASPLLVEREARIVTHAAQLTVPCGGPAAAQTGDGALRIGTTCAGPKDRVLVSASGLLPGAKVKLAWDLGDGSELPVKLPKGGDAVGPDGSFEAEAEVRALVADTAKVAGTPALLVMTVAEPVGWRPSVALLRVLDSLLVTLLSALWATTLGALAAIPISFLAARNVMPRSGLGNLLYRGARSLLTILRAVEPMLWALIFARWVGAGVPFPAIPALALVTFANLGKLFAEAIEDIDAGPVEALQAAGAARLQQLRFGILPQVLLPFLSFGIYFWDITVRMSTVVGFVSGAGIGARLKEWMNGFQYRSAAVAILAIILMVTAMDTLSARIRARLR